MATTYEAIQTTTLASAAATITFSSIAASWTDLRLVITNTSTLASANYLINFNGDTGANYSYTVLSGDASGTPTARSTRATGTTYGFLGLQYVGSSTTIPSFFTLDIFSYAGSTYKTTLGTALNDQNGTGEVMNIVNLWRDTAAITSVLITCNGTTMKVGTIATLYGIKAA